MQLELNGVIPQPLPTPVEDNPHTPIVGKVIRDLLVRAELGVHKYGQALRPFNGRDALVDAYQEALDLACYLAQAIYEREHTDGHTNSSRPE